MARVMRDSIIVGDIPVKGTDIVAVYRNGKYAAKPADVINRFGNMSELWIDVTGEAWTNSDALDIETEDATPGDAPVWIAHRWNIIHAAKGAWYPPILYVNRGNEPQVIAACQGAGYALNADYKLWVATLDGTKMLPNMTGVFAVQYADEGLTGGHYDESIVYDYRFKCPPQSAILVKIPTGITGKVTSYDGGYSFHV